MSSIPSHSFVKLVMIRGLFLDTYGDATHHNKAIEWALGLTKPNLSVKYPVISRCNMRLNEFGHPDYIIDRAFSIFAEHLDRDVIERLLGFLELRETLLGKYNVLKLQGSSNISCINIELNNLIDEIYNILLITRYCDDSYNEHIEEIDDHLIAAKWFLDYYKTPHQAAISNNVAYLRGPEKYYYDILSRLLDRGIVELKESIQMDKVSKFTVTLIAEYESDPIEAPDVQEYPRRSAFPLFGLKSSTYKAMDTGILYTYARGGFHEIESN